MALVSAATLALAAGQPPGDEDVVRVRSPRVALTNVRVIDGTGAPATEDRTIVIENGRITRVGPSSGTSFPADAEVVDLAGHTVIPGLVGMHNHLFYALPPGYPYVPQERTFPRLYLAAGVTTLRTGGASDLARDLAAKRAIAAGEPGPTIYITSPYFGGQDGPRGRKAVTEEVGSLARLGVTSFKAYTGTTRDELRALVETAHAKGLTVTGHLCAVGYGEAARIGIDNLEHGFFANSEFASGKEPDSCPGDPAGARALVEMDPHDPRMQNLIGELVRRQVAITSTLAVFESFTGRREAIDDRVKRVLAPDLRTNWEKAALAAVQRRDGASWEEALKKNMQLERLFAASGGLLMAGADPTGWGCCVAGFADQRNLELLVEAGFTAEQAILIASANGARFLGELSRIGTIAAGKHADLVVIRGNPAARIADIRNVEIVFKSGVGFDSRKLVASVTGLVGEGPRPGFIAQVVGATGLDGRLIGAVLFGGGALLVLAVAMIVQSWMAKARRARRRAPQP